MPPMATPLQLLQHKSTIKLFSSRLHHMKIMLPNSLHYYKRHLKKKHWSTFYRRNLMKLIKANNKTKYRSHQANQKYTLLNTRLKRKLVVQLMTHMVHQHKHNNHHQHMDQPIKLIICSANKPRKDLG
jgi:predicted alpha/beta-fold hydrolase